MEINCVKEDLSAGVTAVERIVLTRSTLPIIGNVLFEAMKDGLRLSANNLEMGLEVTIPAKVKQEGSILIPAKTLGGIVSKLPSESISIKASEKGVVRIAYKQSNVNINGLPSEEFPVLPKIKEAKTITIETRTFVDMVKQTVFSVSQSEDKYVLNGVLFETGKSSQEKDDSNIRLVATDGYRLAKMGEKIGGNPEKNSVIVPAKALIEVSRILQGKERGELKISISNEQIAFKFKDVYMISRLIQGQFPDYKQVIPKSSEVKIEADTGLFLDAAERTAVIASGSSNIVKINTKDGKLHILANTPDVGSADEVVESQIKGEGKAPIAFNVRLLTDVLKVIDTDKISLEFSGPVNPGIIRPVNGADYLYIIMPIRTADTTA